MATIREMENRILHARDSLEQIMFKIIADSKDRIIELNKSQLSEGENTDGNIVGTYSKATETTYGGAELGKYEGDPYNFKWTGDFFGGFDIEFRDGHLEMFSRDSKAKMLQNKYGKGATLLGLNTGNRYILEYEYIKPELLAQLKRIIYNA
jgi:hypothetical protein